MRERTAASAALVHILLLSVPVSAESASQNSCWVRNYPRRHTGYVLRRVPNGDCRVETRLLSRVDRIVIPLSSTAPPAAAIERLYEPPRERLFKRERVNFSQRLKLER
jgi:hypothetical protein